MRINWKDSIGKKYGKLTVMERIKKEGNRRTFLKCICDCGKESVVCLDSLHSGNTRSCGCGVVESTIARSTIHGAARRGKTTRTYKTWQNMRSRCENPKAGYYEIYGGRGIKVCNRWLSFENFLADMGEVPEGMTLDRKDGNGNYESENCRWATPTEQARNTRTNHLLTHKGKTQSLSAWAEEMGIEYFCLKARIKYGWSTERALTEPIHEEKGRKSCQL